MLLKIICKYADVECYRVFGGFVILTVKVV